MLLKCEVSTAAFGTERERVSSEKRYPTFAHKLKKILANARILCYSVRVVKRNGWSSVTETLKSGCTAEEREGLTVRI